MSAIGSDFYVFGCVVKGKPDSNQHEQEYSSDGEIFSTPNHQVCDIVEHGWDNTDYSRKNYDNHPTRLACCFVGQV